MSTEVKDELALYFEQIDAKVKLMTKAELRRWHAALEAERTDKTWLTSSRKNAPEVIRIIDKRPDHAKQQVRDQIMFHSGRFAAGATDNQARNAHQRLQKLLREERG